MTTETGWLVGMVEDLAMAYATGGATGDDKARHGLILNESGDGHSTPREAYWICACGEWAGGDWTQTGYREPVYPPGEHPMDTMPNVRAWLHHVWPSRYTARPSTIMAEVLRSVHQDRR